MKNVRQIVQELGYSLTDEQLEALDKAVRENYATRAELAEKVSRIQTLNDQVKELSGKVEAGKDDAETIAQLKAQVEQFRKSEEDRAKAEDESKRRTAFMGEFDKALDGKSFINDLTRESVFEKAYAMRAANPDMDTRTILATLTADSDNLWANPQNQPSAGIPNDENETAALLEFAKQLFQQ